MRRRAAALAVSGLALGMAFASPWSAQAQQEDTCNDRRISVLTGSRTVAALDPSNVGCTGGANQNTRRILPGASDALIRVSRTGRQPYPVSAVMTTDNKTVDVELTSDNEDPMKAGRFESGYMAIGSTTKLTITVTLSNGSVRATTYTR